MTVLLLVIIMIQSNRKRTNHAQWLHVEQQLCIMIIIMTFSIRNAAQKSKLHNLQYDEGGNHMAETETEKQNKNSRCC